MRFYTSVFARGSRLYVRGYDGGKRFEQTLTPPARLFVPAAEGDYRTLSGRVLDEVLFENFREARDFVQQYSDVGGFEFYGSTNFAYVWLYENFVGEIAYDPSVISVVSIDIETRMKGGFPNIEEADKEITSIALRRAGRSLIFSTVEYVPPDDTIEYVKCHDEIDMLKRFTSRWSTDWSPDIVTGWNIEYFDVPYVVNRTRRILGEEYVKRLSPWRIVSERTAEFRGKVNKSYDLAGIAVLDYLQLYRKFSFKNHESYKLDFIAQAELKEKKVDYSEYGDLDDLMTKNPQLFITYNNKDNVLVLDGLEKKLKLIEQVMALAYDAKINYVDSLTTVRMWETIIHNYLMDRRVCVPQKKHTDGSPAQIPGGYVKDPVPGMYQWVVSFDLNSLYPHLIMQYNISPETLVRRDPMMSMEDLLDGKLVIADTNLTYAANGCRYAREPQGFLPALMEKMYDDRVVYKKKMIEAQKSYEETKSREDEMAIARNHNMQIAKKTVLNSAYGALLNQYYLWFDVDLGSSITLSGQLSTKWIEKKLNEKMNKIVKTEGVDYVIAADTDSIYLNVGPLVERWLPREQWRENEQKIVEAIDRFCEEKLQSYIDGCYGDLAEYVNAREQKMKMKREAISSRGLWTGKKYYVLNVWDMEGVRHHEPELKMKGIASVRSSTPQACRDAIKKALKIMMSGTNDELVSYVEDFRKEFASLPFESIASPRSISGIKKYADSREIFAKGTPIQVKGALIYNRLIKKMGLRQYIPLEDGDKIRFAYLKTPNPLHATVIACPDELPAEFGLDAYVDRDLQFEKAFLDPVRSLALVMGWEVEARSTIEDFFL